MHVKNNHHKLQNDAFLSLLFAAAMRLFENAAFCVAIDVEMEISNDIPRSNYQIEDNLNPFFVLEVTFTLSYYRHY